MGGAHNPGPDFERIRRIVDARRRVELASEPLPDGEALPEDVLEDLAQLVRCDVLSAYGRDTPHGRGFCDQEYPALYRTEEQVLAEEAYFELHYWDSPCSYADRTGDLVSVLRTSDLIPDVEYRQTGMYRDVDLSYGITHEAMVCLDAGEPGRTLRLLFARIGGSDFTDEDVAVLALLRPHLQAAFSAAEARKMQVQPLTSRQLEIMRYVASGYTNGQIARLLDVSESTVGKHLEHVFARLQVGSRSAAVSRLGVAASA